MTALLRYWKPALIVVGAVVGAVWLVQSIREKAVWRERAHVADSTAHVEQRNRVRADQQAAVARALADALGESVTRLTGEADRARERARDAQRDASRATLARDAAIVALRGATGQGDTITALLAKSRADDEVIAGMGVALGERATETGALRAALDSAGRARVALATALDSARAQLRRDGQVIQQLQKVISTARPTTPPRFTKFTLTLGIGYCAIPGQICAGVMAGPSLRIF